VYRFDPSEFKPIGNSDWIVEYNLVELDADGQQVPLRSNVECDYKDCSNDAAFYYRTRCCNTVPLACEYHKNAVMRFLVTMQQSGEIIKCPFCKTNKIPLTLITRPQPLDSTGGL
jgi:hypothetical protein